MKYYLPLFLFALLFASCIEDTCRDCPGLTYDYAAFDPTALDDEWVFTNAAGAEITFVRVRNNETVADEVCSANVGSVRELSCTESAEIQFTSDELELNLSVNYLQLIGDIGEPEQVILSYSFKAPAFSDFLRTHAVILEPQIVLTNDVVELRDSLTINDQLYLEVLELRQPATAFGALVNLPSNGRFTTISIKEGVGVLRLTDVDGNTYLRQF
ncbi:MAG: hypothetical protein ACJAZ9_001373 [Neolewinella sp.]|jgi:hypothetical protein